MHARAFRLSSSRVPGAEALASGPRSAGSGRGCISSPRHTRTYRNPRYGPVFPSTVRRPVDGGRRAPGHTEAAPAHPYAGPPAGGVVRTLPDGWMPDTPANIILRIGMAAEPP